MRMASTDQTAPRFLGQRGMRGGLPAAPSSTDSTAVKKEDLEHILAGVRRTPADHFRQLLHPLCGADLTTLLGVLVGSGGIAPPHPLRAGVAPPLAMIPWPFST